MDSHPRAWLFRTAAVEVRDLVGHHFERNDIFAVFFTAAHVEGEITIDADRMRFAWA
jgi:hypothetical protein